MKQVSQIVFVLLILNMVMSSCTMEKRRYLSGYHIDWHGPIKKPHNSSLRIPEAKSVKEQLPEIKNTQPDLYASSDGQHLEVELFEKTFTGFIDVGNNAEVKPNSLAETRYEKKLTRYEFGENVYSPNRVQVVNQNKRKTYKEDKWLRWMTGPGFGDIDIYFLALVLLSLFIALVVLIVISIVKHSRSKKSTRNKPSMHHKRKKSSYQKRRKKSSFHKKKFKH